ncbi:MAG: hypothetical protein K2Q32_09550, partial [Alphaproteobacteria bacterium]|nr:hypothetical protein [Alphaproteobacteria bacterium]
LIDLHLLCSPGSRPPSPIPCHLRGGAFVAGMLTTQLKFKPYVYLQRIERFVLGDTLDQNIVWQHKVQLFDPNMEGVTTIMLGDSLTAYHDWNLSLKRNDIYNYGIPGDTSDKLLQRVSQSNIIGKKIFLMIGINDLSQGISWHIVAENIKKTLHQLSSQNTVYLLSTLYTQSPELNLAVTELKKAEQQMCADKCIFIDLNSQLAPDGLLSKNLSIDMVHINNAAYGLWSNTIKNFLPAIK